MKNLIKNKTVKIQELENIQNYENCNLLIKDNEKITVMICALKNEDISNKTERKPLTYNKNINYYEMLKLLMEENDKLHQKLDILNLKVVIDSDNAGVDNGN